MLVLYRNIIYDKYHTLKDPDQTAPSKWHFLPPLPLNLQVQTSFCSWFHADNILWCFKRAHPKYYELVFKHTTWRLKTSLTCAMSLTFHLVRALWDILYSNITWFKGWNFDYTQWPLHSVATGEFPKMADMVTFFNTLDLMKGLKRYMCTTLCKFRMHFTTFSSWNLKHELSWKVVFQVPTW